MKELQLNDGLRGNGGLHQCRQASLILQLSVWGVQSGWQADQRCQNLQHMGSKMLWLVFIKKKKSRKTRPTKNVICKIDRIPKLFNIFICDSEGAPSS